MSDFQSIDGAQRVSPGCFPLAAGGKYETGAIVRSKELRRHHQDALAERL
jgi:hypothetical protein